MPNWCSTSYVVMGDKEEIRSLYETMKDLENHPDPLVKSDFGNEWLGCLVTSLGKDWQEVRCRGSWSNLELEEDDEIRFDTETAWVPMNEVMDLICQRFPSLTYYFCAEEPGCVLYETNDSEGVRFPERYKVELCTPSEIYDLEYFETEWTLLEWLKNHYGIHLYSLEEATSISEEWEKQNPNAYLSIHKFEIV